MEIQEIETFIAVSQAESFSKAADRLGYSQAAVTVHIKNLEEELGVRLFDRLGKRISLTSQGQSFYEKAVTISNSIKELKLSVTDRPIKGGHLNIGTIDSICATIFPDILRGFHEHFPDITIDVTTESPQGLLERLKNNQLDLIYLLDDRIHLPWIKKAMEEKEQIVFVAEKDHPMADGRDHSIHEILQYPTMLTERDASYRRVLEEKLEALDQAIHPVFSSNNTDLLLKVLKGSGAITFLPRYTILDQVEAGKLAEIPLSDLQVHIYRQIIYHKDKWVNGAMQEFMHYLQDFHDAAHA